MDAVRFTVKGRVQGVGFRYFAASTADRLELDGYVENQRDGSVVAVCSGEAGDIELFERALHKGPAFSRVDSVVREDIVVYEEFEGFSIR